MPAVVAAVVLAAQLPARADQAAPPAAEVIARLLTAVANIATTAFAKEPPVAGNMVAQPTASQQDAQSSGFFIDPSGVLTLTTSNNAASSTIGIVTGSSTAANQAFAAFSGLAGPAAVADPNAQATRSGLIEQYNNILKQIDTTSQDSSFNGINLLEGDTLNLTFDETGKSTLAIKGVTFNTAGLGLSTLTSGTDFLDSNSANSQALSTRQSIAVSALSLANQSQQSVLQLLR